LDLFLLGALEGSFENPLSFTSNTLDTPRTMLLLAKKYTALYIPTGKVPNDTLF
jgi:hypothetical protein